MAGVSSRGQSLRYKIGLEAGHVLFSTHVRGQSLDFKIWRLEFSADEKLGRKGKKSGQCSVFRGEDGRSGRMNGVRVLGFTFLRGFKSSSGGYERSDWLDAGDELFTFAGEGAEVAFDQDAVPVRPRISGITRLP